MALPSAIVPVTGTMPCPVWPAAGTGKVTPVSATPEALVVALGVAITALNVVVENLTGTLDCSAPVKLSVTLANTVVNLVSFGFGLIATGMAYTVTWLGMMFSLAFNKPDEIFN
ncbi:hypothetical protein ACL2XP_02430 [Sodalis sp. RH21]|uniref:hypothetical protein n=1 Tax=unclassified Sodalis (in: enterobacteria) TaxID=2636512 RepID=UPI0039B3BD7C